MGTTTIKKLVNAGDIRQVNLPGPQDRVLQACFQELFDLAIYAQAAYVSQIGITRPNYELAFDEHLHAQTHEPIHLAQQSKSGCKMEMVGNDA